MRYFFIGLCLAVLGFGVFQFSRLFNVYSAINQRGIPVPYWILNVTAYSLMTIGTFLLVVGLM